VSRTCSRRRVRVNEDTRFISDALQRGTLKTEVGNSPDLLFPANIIFGYVILRKRMSFQCQVGNPVETPLSSAVRLWSVGVPL